MLYEHEIQVLVPKREQDLKSVVAKVQGYVLQHALRPRGYLNHIHDHIN